MTFQRVFSQGAQLLIFLFAARLLGPSAFGLFALVSAFAILMVRVSEAGWADYIMAWKGGPEVPAQVFGVAILAGFSAAVLGLGAAAGLKALEATEPVPGLAAWFAIWLLLATTSAALNGILVWQGRLGRAALVRIAAEIVAVVVSILALQAGHGVLALVEGRCAQELAAVGLGTLTAQVRPRAGMPRDQLAELLRFCGHILGARLLNNFRGHALTFIVGGLLGTTAVGYLRAGQRIASAFGEIAGEPARLFAWARFRDGVGGRGAGPDFEAVALRFYPVLIGLAVPVFLWLGIFAQDITVGLLGQTWAPSAEVVAILALSYILQLTSYTVEPVMALAGQVRQIPRLSLLATVATVGLTFLGAHWGILGVAWAQVAAGGVVLVLTHRLIERHAGVRWRRVGRACVPVLGVGLAVAALLLGVRQAGVLGAAHPLLRASLLSLPALGLYVLVLSALFPDFRRFLSPRLGIRAARPPAGEVTGTRRRTQSPIDRNHPR